MNNAQTILNHLESAGFRAAFLPYHCIDRIKQHYDSLVEKNPGVKRTQSAVDYFRKHQPPEISFQPQSFLVAAYPDNPAQFILNIDGKPVTIPIPPTYRNYETMRMRFEEIMKSSAEGYQTSRSNGISQKLLAVLSGLGRYGRNNIFYLDGSDTYCHLMAVYTDIPCDDISYPIMFMDECESCGLCRQNCPTGAIGEFPVVDTSRCLTMLNEHKNPMPDWLPENVHHALIGCMRCQEICPKIKSLPAKTVDTLELDKDETRFLLSSDTSPLPPELEQKIKEFGMHEFSIGVLGRNAKLVLEN